MKARLKQNGFTIVELLVVVAIIGVLAAISGPAFVRFIRISRTAEATTTLRKLYDGETNYFLNEQFDRNGNTVTAQFVDCGPMPSLPPGTNKGLGDWRAECWLDLSFAQDGPVFYSYSTLADGVSTSSSFTVRAEGDLDGDNIYSLFERTGFINSATGEIQGSAGVYSTRASE